MADKKNKLQVKSNLDNATPEEWERFMENLVEAHRILYRSVVERKIKQLFR